MRKRRNGSPDPSDSEGQAPRRDQARRVGISEVWVKTTPEGDPHPKAAQLMEDIQNRYPEAEVRLDRQQGFYDRALLRVLYPEGPDAQGAAQGVQELIRSYQGGIEANLLTGKVFTLRVPVDPNGQVADLRAREAIEEIKEKFPKAELETRHDGGVATVDIYLRHLTDAQRFMAAYHTIREIVRRHKSEPPGSPRPREE